MRQLRPRGIEGCHKGDQEGKQQPGKPQLSVCRLLNINCQMTGVTGVCQGSSLVLHSTQDPRQDVPIQEMLC